MISAGRVRDWCMLLVCNLIWASFYVIVKLVQREMGPIFATFFPMTISTVLLIALVRAPADRRFRMRDLGGFLLIGLFGQVLTQLSGTWGGRLSPAANASLISFTLPVLTAVMAYFLLGERMTAIRWISFVLAIAGVLQCSDIDWKELNFRSRSLLAANILLFLSMLGSAFYNVYSKRLLVRYTPLQVLLYSYYVVVAALLPVTVYVEPEGFRNLPHYTATAWIGMAMLALFQYGLSMVIFLRVLSRIDATQAALSNYLMPFFGVIIAAISLGERLTKPMIFGGLLVLASTLLATAYESRQEAARREETAKEAEPA